MCQYLYRMMRTRSEGQQEFFFFNSSFEASRSFRFHYENTPRQRYGYAARQAMGKYLKERRS